MCFVLLYFLVIHLNWVSLQLLSFVNQLVLKETLLLLLFEEKCRQDPQKEKWKMNENDQNERKYFMTFICLSTKPFLFMLLIGVIYFFDNWLQINHCSLKMSEEQEGWFLTNFGNINTKIRNILFFLAKVIFFFFFEFSQEWWFLYNKIMVRLREVILRI